MHQTSLLKLCASTLLLLGCAGSAHVRGSASASATTPDLVYVSPGVQVIADYREPIFYADRYYWRFNGNVWYRSSSYTSGWVRYQAPVAILRIERPTAYVYYRGSARASTAPHTAPAMTREERKDERDAQKEARKDERDAQKEERKDEREAQKEERKDVKEAQKDARKDAKEAQKDAKKDRK